MKITSFPLGEIPYRAIDRLSTIRGTVITGRLPIFDESWYPQEWKEDIKSGKPTPLVYWYPYYKDLLFDISLEGENFRDFLRGFHVYNSYYFDLIFVEVSNTLDKLAKTSLKLNHLNEITIKNGRMKL